MPQRINAQTVTSPLPFPQPTHTPTYLIQQTHQPIHPSTQPYPSHTHFQHLCKQLSQISTIERKCGMIFSRMVGTLCGKWIKKVFAWKTRGSRGRGAAGGREGLWSGREGRGGRMGLSGTRHHRPQHAIKIINIIFTLPHPRGYPTPLSKYYINTPDESPNLRSRPHWRSAKPPAPRLCNMNQK